MGPSDRTSDETPPRVYLDVMLGSLARLLRMAGWDAAYALDRDVEADDEVLREATAENRILLTRDRHLADRAPEGLLLTSRDVDDQVAELRAAGYRVELDSPERCASCNGSLIRLSPDSETPAHAPDLDEQAVWRCRGCGQVFWTGSHWADVSVRLETDEEEG